MENQFKRNQQYSGQIRRYKHAGSKNSDTVMNGALVYKDGRFRLPASNFVSHKCFKTSGLKTGRRSDSFLSNSAMSNRSRTTTKSRQSQRSVKTQKSQKSVQSQKSIRSQKSFQSNRDKTSKRTSSSLKNIEIKQKSVTHSAKKHFQSPKNIKPRTNRTTRHEDWPKTQNSFFKEGYTRKLPLN